MDSNKLGQCQTRTIPLVVDLDGTLLCGDMLHECAMRFVRETPLEIWRLVPWLTQGRNALKYQLAEHVDVDVTVLPYREEVVEYVKSARASGRRTVLATATDERIARKIADHLGVFDEVLGSNLNRNLKGHVKLSALEQAFGKGGFDYIGDSPADRPIFAAARKAIIVCGREGIAKSSGNSNYELLQPPISKSRPLALLKSLRPHQWLKNVLVFVPVLVGHHYTDSGRVMQSVFAFVVMSLCASGVYVMNDLLDLQADRVHSRKRRRPFASGTVGIPTGVVMSLALFVLAGGLGLLWGGLLLFCLLVLYASITTAYSFYIKRTMFADILTLAGLYTYRVFVGGMVTGIVLSNWLLAFSMFMFLSLATLKRYAELETALQVERNTLPNRSYMVIDRPLVMCIGVTSAYMAVMVLGLYINTAEVVKHYTRPQVLWLLCPVLIYWLSRLWFLVNRRVEMDDPVVYALSDRRSLFLLLLVFVIFLTASV